MTGGPATGRALRVGWVGSPRAGLPDDVEVSPFSPSDPGPIASGAADVWVVDAAAAPEVVDAVIASRRPVLARVGADEAALWWPHVASGRAEVVAPSAPPAELRARFQGLLSRDQRWSPVTARLATTVAHDLRSPLQGMRFTLAMLEREGVLAGANEDDLNMLLAVADHLEVVLHGLYNLGRAVSEERGELVDVAHALREEAGRVFFTGRVQVDAPERAMWVRGNPGDVRYALLDLLRAPFQLLVPDARGERRSVQVEVTSGPARSGAGVEVSIRVKAQVFPVVAPHLPGLLDRVAPLLLRGQVRLPFAGVAFAHDVFRGMGGALEVRGEGPMLCLDATLPLVIEG
jgi:signal transduction histidine kinase